MTEKEPSVIQKVSSASLKDVDVVWGIIKPCSDWLLEHGHKHWDEFYSERRMGQKIKKSDVRIAYISGEPVGIIALDTRQVAYYTRENMQSFAEPEAEAMYISALATHPDYHGMGIASELMDMAENEAISRGIRYARIDCKALYLELVEFYRNREYRVTGLLIDDVDNYEPYFLMEKDLV